MFVQAGYDAVITAMQQLNDSKAMEQSKEKNLTHNDRKGALDYLTLLKKNICGKIKVRGCAVGRKQKKKRVLSPFKKIRCYYPVSYVPRRGEMLQPVISLDLSCSRTCII